MAQNLWEIRQKKKMTVKQLAGKSGVKAGNIYAYESGDPIRMADLGKLAKALYVDSSDIKIESDPLPKKKKKPTPTKQAAPKPAPAPALEKRPLAPQPSQSAKPQQAKLTPSPPAREGQLTHLLGLAEKFGQSEDDVSERIGKPFSELTVAEARKWLVVYAEGCKTLRPDDTRRKRVHLPEAVDAFELNYLTTQQEAEAVIIFSLLDKTEFSGRIVGFSPYNITIQQTDGSQMTIQKLALAYYSVAEAAS